MGETKILMQSNIMGEALHGRTVQNPRSPTRPNIIARAMDGGFKKGSYQSLQSSSFSKRHSGRPREHSTLSKQSSASNIISRALDGRMATKGHGGATMTQKRVQELLKAKMMHLGFDEGKNLDNTLLRLRSAEPHGESALRDGIGYGIASIL